MHTCRVLTSWHISSLIGWIEAHQINTGILERLIYFWLFSFLPSFTPHVSLFSRKQPTSSDTRWRDILPFCQPPMAQNLPLDRAVLYLQWYLLSSMFSFFTPSSKHFPAHQTIEISRNLNLGPPSDFNTHVSRWWVGGWMDRCILPTWYVSFSILRIYPNIDHIYIIDYVVKKSE